MALEWIEQVTDAVKTLVPRERAARPRPRPLGRARKVAAGVYAVSTAREQISVDSMVELHLADRGSNGPDRATYRVIAVEEGHGELRVHVGPHAPEGGLWLWGTGRAAGALERSLLEAWQGLTDPGLAARLVDGWLDPVPATVPEAGALHGDQARAHYACTTPGVRLVWGPPGTGKTTVLARAIDDLLARGKRILLVSATNIAVDNALSAVIQMRRPPPGELVRVGAPALAQIAQDDRVALPRLVQARLRTLTERRDEVGRQLLELATSPEARRLAELDRRLDGFDAAGYRAAYTRVQRDRHVEALTADLSRAEHRYGDAEQARDSRRSAYRDAASELAAISTARAELASASQLRAESDRLDALAAAAAGEVLSAEQRLRKARQERETVPGGSPRTWLQYRAERSRLDKAVSAQQADLASVVAARDEARRLAEQHRMLATPLIAAHEQAATPVTSEEVARREKAVGAARNAVGEADEVLRLSGQKVARIRAALDEAIANPGATEEDRTTVDDADRAGLPLLAAERDRLAQKAAPLLTHRQTLEQHYEKLLTDIDRARAGAEPTIISQARLVAATLTRFRLDATVYGTPYDAVFVDEAAAAQLPEVLLAATKARQTVVLLGDFCQLGPVRDEKKIHSAGPHARWLLRNCFDLVGVTTPADALAREGCVTLRITRRFGPHVVTLANRIAYGGLLTAPPADRPPSVDDPQIVLLDTDGLGDLGRVRVPAADGGRWWLAGSVLSRALAEHHREQGESVGIITPYRAQSLATIDHLDDLGSLGGDPPVEGGTAHTFQGREFDIVVADLVEDGEVPGWSAKASMRSASSFERNGARLINVVVTRARHRVYLLTSGHAVRSAHPDSTFSQLAALVDEGAIRVVRAADLLGLPAGELNEKWISDPLLGELWETFAGHVVAEAVFDEFGYIPAVLEAITRATSSVWLWSPWFGARQDEILPTLALARDRGVEITVFIVDDSDSVVRSQRTRGPDLDRRLAELRGVATRLTRVRQMHQKIVIIDREIMFLGSYNTLSSRARREIMVRYRGRRFAEQVLQHERAEELARPPSCERHVTVMEARRSSSPKKGFAWSWACPTKGCPERRLLGPAATSSDRLNSPRRPTAPAETGMGRPSS